MLTDTQCLFEYDDNIMMQMLDKIGCSSFECSQNACYDNTRTLKSDLKSGIINNALIDFDNNISKLFNAFTLNCLIQDKDLIMEKLKVQVTQTYPICTEQAFKIWSDYKGNIITRTKPYLLQPRRSDRIEKKRKISLQEFKGEESDEEADQESEGQRIEDYFASISDLEWQW